MANLDNANLSTTKALGEGPEEQKFLRSQPWVLDAGAQDPDTLIRALRYEASRFHELHHQPRFSLLAVMRDVKARHLQDLILSCRCQSYHNWQLLLVDDGSRSRESRDVARNWSTRDQRIVLKSLEDPVGPSRARNLTFSEATGDYLSVIDADGMLHPMALGVLALHQ